MLGHERTHTSPRAAIEHARYGSILGRLAPSRLSTLSVAIGCWPLDPCRTTDSINSPGHACHLNVYDHLFYQKFSWIQIPTLVDVQFESSSFFYGTTRLAGEAVIEEQSIHDHSALEEYLRTPRDKGNGPRQAASSDYDGSWSFGSSGGGLRCRQRRIRELRLSIRGAPQYQRASDMDNTRDRGFRLRIPGAERRVPPRFPR